MTNQQDQPDHNHQNSPSHFRSAGIPSCLWFLLGMGAALVLVVGGLLAAVFSITKSGSPATSPVLQTASITPYQEGKATLTPYFTPGATLDQTQTPSPNSEDGTGLNPEVIRQMNPGSQTGVIYIEPFLSADAGNFSLAPGEIVTLRWEEYPPGALRYYFLYQPHAVGSQLTIGVDGNPTDGVQVEWIVPENLSGDLYGVAVFEEDQKTSALLAGAVYSGTLNESSQAVAVLTEFFRTLSLGQYQAAADLYGGDYSVLEEYNPDMDPAHHARLLERACTANGFICLPVWTVESVQPLSDHSFLVAVTFQNPDGSIYSLEGCCGGSEENPAKSVFSLRVAQADGGFWQVMDLPVYSP